MTDTKYLRTLGKYFNEVKESVFQFQDGLWKDNIQIETNMIPEKKRKSENLIDEENDDSAEEHSYLLTKLAENDDKTASIIKMSRQVYYGRIPHNHRPPISPRIADPIYRNPNSFESMIEIFREIRFKNRNRKWVAIVMDGVPYVLGLKVTPILYAIYFIMVQQHIRLLPGALYAIAVKECLRKAVGSLTAKQNMDKPAQTQTTGWNLTTYCSFLVGDIYL